MLEGTTIVDLSRLVPGPFCTMLLADLGARVIQVDPPQNVPDVTGTSFPTLLRNKQRIVLNLKSEDGRKVLFRLLEQADALVEGFRPGTTRRLGVDYDSARRTNKRLVYCSISGYGQKGRRAAQAGHDVNFLAASGILDLMITRGSTPSIPAVQFADTTGAMQGALAIVAALYQAARTGEGRQLDISMTDAVVPLAVTSITFMQMGWPYRAGESLVGGGLACYNVYETRDGRLLSVGALEAVFFDRLCRTLGVEELVKFQYVLPKQPELKAKLQEIFVTRTAAEWEDLFSDVDACVVAAAKFEDSVADAMFRESGAIRACLSDDGEEKPILGTPIAVADSPPADPAPIPERGEHTEALLQELGYSEEERLRLRGSRSVE